MKSLYRWIAHLTLAPLAVLTLQGIALPAQAFTDANAEMKERAADARVVVVAKAAPAKPKQVAWVPPTPKALDGFKPVLPPEPAHAADGSQTLAKADTPARVKR